MSTPTEPIPGFWYWGKPEGAPWQFLRLLPPEDAGAVPPRIDFWDASGMRSYRPLISADRVLRRVSPDHDSVRDEPITICALCGQRLGCWMCRHTICDEYWQHGARALDVFTGSIRMVLELHGVNSY